MFVKAPIYPKEFTVFSILTWFRMSECTFFFFAYSFWACFCKMPVSIFVTKLLITSSVMLALEHVSFVSLGKLSIIKSKSNSTTLFETSGKARPNNLTLWWFWGYLFYPLNIMEHVYGHGCTSPRFGEPSWTFIDHQMDPKMDPARLILWDPCQKRPPGSLQGPYWSMFLHSRGPPRCLRVRSDVPLRVKLKFYFIA